MVKRKEKDEVGYETITRVERQGNKTITTKEKRKLSRKNDPFDVNGDSFNFDF